ncbi:MAG TPA: hypothetical protein VHY48_07890 [Acidobacteriaceae bacterium]|jgi:hypothetical protein|nr:hypothetical protein [Acidobacteriaceae bacterium]
MSTLSYQERSLYGSLAAELIIYLPYFVLHHGNSVNKVAGMIFSIIVLQILLQSIIAAVTRHRMTDERDKLIQLRGYRAGYLTLASLMVVGLGMLWFHTLAGHNFPIHAGFVGLHFLNVFFGMLVISDIVKTVTQILAYRKAL